MKNITEIERKIISAQKDLAELDARRSLLLQMIKQLQEERDLIDKASTSSSKGQSLVSNQSPEAEKVSLFRSFFKGREDLYPRRFESRRTGKTGYQPACGNEWIKGICEKPKIKCGECENRNNLIIDDVISAVDRKRSPILLTERKEHLSLLENCLSSFVKNLIVLKGGTGKRERQQIAEMMDSIPDDEERLILATGRYLGEGFDDPRLDTLFLVLPVSWRGIVAQYAGRLHRLYDMKKEVIIYDYVDLEVPMLAKMYRRRLAGYKAIGYEVKE